MKKILSLFFCIFFIVGCSLNEAITEPQSLIDDKPEQFSFFANKGKVETEVFIEGLPQSRTSIVIKDDGSLYGDMFVVWTPPYDEIGIVKMNNNGKLAPAENHAFRLSDDSNPKMDFDDALFVKRYDDLELPNGSYAVYYPYHPYAISGGTVNFNLPKQVQKDNGDAENFGKCSFMYSTSSLDKTVAKTVNDSKKVIPFQHAFAFLDFKISGLSEGTIIYKIEVTGTKELFYQTVELVSSTTDNSIRVSYSNPATTAVLHTGNSGYYFSEGDTYNGWLVIANYGIGSTVQEPVVINIHTNVGIFTVNKDTPFGGFVAGKRYVVNLNGLMNATTPVVTEWIAEAPSRIEGNTIYIYNEKELTWISGVSNGDLPAIKGIPRNFNGFNIELLTNLDLQGVPWVPISGFKGSFEGNYYAISGLLISSSTDHNNIGLFKNNDGIIKNLYLSNPVISVDKNNIGAFVGTNNNNGEVRNCNIVNGGLIEGNTNIGGIVGNNNGIVSHCSIDRFTTVNATKKNGAVGDIVGTGNPHQGIVTN